MPRSETMAGLPMAMTSRRARAVPSRAGPHHDEEVEGGDHGEIVVEAIAGEDDVPLQPEGRKRFLDALLYLRAAADDHELHPVHPCRQQLEAPGG